jgi:hypothetical protein
MKLHLFPAIALVLGLSLTACGQDQSPPTAGSESPSPTESKTPDPTPTLEPTPTAPTPSASSTGSTGSPEAITVSLKGLKPGATPGLAYLLHEGPAWRLMLPGGGSVPVGRAYYDFAMTGGSGFVGMRIGDASVVDVVDGSGSVTHTEKAIGYQLAVTPDGQMVGWVRPGGVPVDYEVATDEVLTGPKVQGGTDLAALAGKKTCREAESEVNGCLWLVADGDQGTWGASSHGIVDQLPGLGTAADIDDDGYVVGISSTSDEGSCSVFIRAWRKPRWETCDYRLRTFSPQGSRISATNAYADGLGDTQLAVLGRDGSVQQEFRAARGVTFMTARWEDEDHLLVVAYAQGKSQNGWSILRLGVDGSAEVAVPAIAGDDYQARLVLPSR